MFKLLRLAIFAALVSTLTAAWVTAKVVVALCAVMLLSIGWQVAMRYLINRPPSWTEELALLCFTWCSLLMLAMGVRQAFHARMDLLVHHLPAPWAGLIERMVKLGVAFFGAYFIGSLIYFVISATTGDPIAKIGYKNGVVIGLLISATGSAMFWPAAP